MDRRRVPGGAADLMWPVSAKFAAAIMQSHDIAVQVEVLQSNIVTATLDTVIDGTVSLDGRAQSRGRLDIQIADDGTLGLIPTAVTDMLAPYGTELRVSRGILYPDATTELVPLGVFRIDRCVIDGPPGAVTLKISGLDRSAKIIDARFEEPYPIAQGTGLAAVLTALAEKGDATVVTDFTPTSVTTPAIVPVEGDDRWKLMQEFATAAGLRLYYDGLGVLVLAPEVADVEAAITLAEGEGGVLLDAGRDWTRQGASNRWIVTGENTGETAPVRAVATDTNPLSPTVYGGAFGQVPKFFQSQFIRTVGQAQDAADAMKSREQGTTKTVRFDTPVLPHLEPGDVAHVTRTDIGVDEDHLIDSLTIPLTAQAGMSGQTRAVLVTA